jgi:outer membrane scaffolding protein for murein synthesis (MipA/OmpV family)
MTSIKLTTTLALAALFTASSAYAQEGGYIAAGIGASPEYEGSPDQQVIPFLAARFQSGGRSIALEGLALRADLLGTDSWEAGPVATYTFGRDKDVETIASRLDVIDGAVELGAYAARTWSDGT